jgi:hypothetical protein
MLLCFVPTYFAYFPSGSQGAIRVCDRVVVGFTTTCAVIRKEEMIMGHCSPIITTFNGPFQCSLCKN